MADRTKQTLGSAPIQDDLRAPMNAIATALDDLFNPDGTKVVGFILLTFPFGHEGRCNYISNADRADVVTLLREQLAYFSGMPETKGRG